MQRKFRKLINSPRFQLSIIAATAVTISGILGLSAYLTDVTTPEVYKFTMKTDNTFGISLNTRSFSEDQVIMPGGFIKYDPYISSKSSHPAYVYIKITLPDETFHLDKINNGWSLLSNEDNTYVYYYGVSDQLTVVPAMTGSSNISQDTQPLCDLITLDADTPILDDTYEAEATGYAIQADAVHSKDSKKVWSMVNE